MVLTQSFLSFVCCSVSVGNISLHFQTFILPLIVIIQWDFWAPHRLNPEELWHLKSNQIKSLLLSHDHSTCALVSEILESVLQTVQKQFTYRQYILTDLYRWQCTEYTYIHSVHIVYYKDILSYQYTLYTVCTHSTLCTHLYIVICEGATDYTLYNR